jgi:apolipoprotein D and lipocalin family protein
MSRLTALLAVVLMLSGCGFSNYRDQDVQMSSYATLDVERYTGLWYEIARFPVPFQEGCVATTARYDVIDAGTLSVLNTCRDGGVGGPLKQIEGKAELTGPGRLDVSFPSVPFAKSPYWVLWVDEGYRTAVVGVPSGTAGWILNRDPQIPEDRLEAARRILEFNGYDISQLEMTPQVAN